MKKWTLAILVTGALLLAPATMAKEHEWSLGSLWEMIVTSLIVPGLDIESAPQPSNGGPLVDPVGESGDITDGGPLIDPVGEPVTDGGPLIDPVGLSDNDGNGGES